MLVRLGMAVLAMEAMALIVALLAFGWPALLVGGPLLVGTVVALVVVRLSEGPRRRLQERRATRWDADATLPGGLMSGFFEIPSPRR